MKIKVDVPSDLEEYAPFMEGLLRLQVAKLYVNAHKATPERREIEVFIRRMREEIEELETQLGDNRLDGNGLLEIADIANFALLSFIALRNEQMEQKGNVTERSTLKDPGVINERIRKAAESVVNDARTHVGPSFEVVHSSNYPAPERGRAQLLRGADGVEGGERHSLEGYESGPAFPEPVGLIARLTGGGDGGLTNAGQAALAQSQERRARANGGDGQGIRLDEGFD